MEHGVGGAKCAVGLGGVCACAVEVEEGEDGVLDGQAGEEGFWNAVDELGSLFYGLEG